MKIRYKLTLVFTGLMAAIILLLSIFIYVFSVQNVRQSFFKRLEKSAAIIGHATLEEDERSTAIYYEVKEKHLQDLPNEKVYILRIKKGATGLRYPSPLPLPDEFYGRVIREGKQHFQLGGISYAGMFFEDKTHADDLMVITYASDLYGRQELGHLQFLLISGFLLAVALVFTISILFSRQIFRPVREMIREVDNINAQNLNLRLPKGNGKDEISELAATFNGMLDRLETAFRIQSNFIGNASHSLRTPLTVIGGEAELALSRIDPGHELGYSFQVIMQESEKLRQIVNSLLSLAATGYDGKREYYENVRIDELLWTVKEEVDNLAPENQVIIDYNQLPEDEWWLSVRGNTNLLNLAVTNVVLNACKYSGNNVVVMKLTANNDGIVISVKDIGIGIPAAEVEQIFTPFFRASNTALFHGYGLGLSLSLNIVRLHGGSIQVFSEEEKGTDVRVILPAGRLPDDF